jgi:hypothetical protein
MTSPHALLTPALALVAWSLVVWVWMYATRIPAIREAGIDPGAAREKSSLDALPLEVRQVADNYNHLMEQPTIFYALILYGYLAGDQNVANVALAWASPLEWFTAWSRRRSTSCWCASRSTSWAR